mmetsp:Transcript_9256/g.13456  ORF Transcript_9256/g.13456 Transcript_9256/m.13456 type:complete len:242 (-) Transcript_9256:147-872(-)
MGELGLLMKLAQGQKVSMDDVQKAGTLSRSGSQEKHLNDAASPESLSASSSWFSPSKALVEKVATPTQPSSWFANPVVKAPPIVKTTNSMSSWFGTAPISQPEPAPLTTAGSVLAFLGLVPPPPLPPTPKLHATASTVTSAMRAFLVCACLSGVVYAYLANKISSAVFFAVYYGVLVPALDATIMSSWISVAEKYAACGRWLFALMLMSGTVRVFFARGVSAPVFLVSYYSVLVLTVSQQK